MAVLDDKTFKMDEETSKKNYDIEMNMPEEMKEKLDAVKTEDFKVTAIVKTPTKLEKFKKSIFVTAAKDVGSYMLNDVLIPAIKTTFRDLVCNSIDVALWGEKRGRSSRSIDRDRGTYVSYDGYYDTRRDGGRRSSSKNIENVTFRSRSEAMAVLDHMIDVATEYDYCSVAKFNSMCGLHGDYTDTDFGWSVKDLKRAVVTEDRSGDVYISIDSARSIR